MDFLASFLSIHTVMVDVAGYPLSWIEFFGTASGLVCVWLTARERLSGWVAGIVNAALFFALFFQVRLYSDMLLQVFYLVTSVWGIWRWSHPRSPEEENRRKRLKIRALGFRDAIVWAGGAAVGALVLGALTFGLHEWLPVLFPDPPSFPWANALVASMSVAATFLMTGKRLQCWWFWIAVDSLGAAIYAMKGVAFLSAEYVVFGLICLTGLSGWRREMRSYGEGEAAA